MKIFSDFSELDSYFCRLFSHEDNIFLQLKHEDVSIGIALQHNIYDYYKTFVLGSGVKSPIPQKILSLARIYGFDHRVKFAINNFIGTKCSSLPKGKTIFFADNHVPRILEDFRKVIAEMNMNSVAFVTTDYRAYKFMRRKEGNKGLQVALLGPGLNRNAVTLNKKEILSYQLIIQLQNEFGGLAKNILRIIRSNLGVLSRYYDLFEKYLKQARPAKIILGSDGFSIARILCLAAKKYEINTYVLQHGLIDSLNGYLPLVADYIFSWSQYEKEFFQKSGVAPQRLLVAGSPRFDQEHQLWNNERKSVNNQLLFVISPGTPQDVYDQIDDIIKITEGLKGSYDFLIRPHPYYKNIAKTYFNKLGGKSNILLDEKPFLYSINESKLVVFTDISTGIFEALSMSKSVYILSNKAKNKFDIYNFPKIEMADLINGLNNGLSLIREFDLSGSSSSKPIPSSHVKSSVAIASYLNESH